MAAEKEEHNVVIVGASGGVGRALVDLYGEMENTRVFALSRSKVSFSGNGIKSISIDICNEVSVIHAAAVLKEHGEVDRVIVATGLLHNERVQPEKNIRQIDAASFDEVFRINATGPALLAKHFLPLLKRSSPAVFSVLSARVGSISDNRLGGWYAYRASKAALNMIVKNLAIECARTQPKTIVTALHPGTTDTALSAPFQRNVKPEKLFSPEFVAQSLHSVLNGLSQECSGRIYDWAGKEIQP